MCYAFNPDKILDIKIVGLERDEYLSLFEKGLVPTSIDGFYYPKAMVGSIHHDKSGIKVSPMRWDLIPPGFLAGEPQFSLAEIIKKKNSRAINPETGKKWGYDSYNARVESVATTWSFKAPWKDGKRCVIPLTAFKERPNMDGAPPDKKGKEFKIELDGTYFLGGIWDTFERNGETLDSCTVITMDSAGHKKIQDIYHERHPLILTPLELEEWLDPKTSPGRALEMVQQLDGSHMNIKEIPKKPKPKA